MNDVLRVNAGKDSMYGTNMPVGAGRSSAGPVRSTGASNGFPLSTNQQSMNRESGRYGVNDPVRLSAGATRSNSCSMNDPVRLSSGNSSRSVSQNYASARSNQLSSGAYGAFTNNSRMGSGRR
jgi:hypothetical protein